MTKILTLRPPNATKQDSCSHMGAVVAFFFSFPGVLVVLIKGSAGLPEQKCFKINVFSLVLNESSCVSKLGNLWWGMKSELSLNIKLLINDWSTQRCNCWLLLLWILSYLGLLRVRNGAVLLHKTCEELPNGSMHSSTCLRSLDLVQEEGM